MLRDEGALCRDNGSWRVTADLDDGLDAGLLHLEQASALRGDSTKQGVSQYPGQIGDQTLAHNFGRAFRPKWLRLIALADRAAAMNRFNRRDEPEED